MSFNLTAFMFFIISISVIFGFNQLSFINLPLSILLIAGMTTFLICWKFNKSRAGFMTLLIIGIFFNSLQIPFVSAPSGLFMLLISFNVMLISIFKEKGVFSVHGLKKTGYFLIQLFAVYLIALADMRFINSFSNYFTLALIFLIFPVFKAVFFDKDHSLSAALGSIIALVITAGINIDINGSQCAASFAVIFAGVIFSVYSTSYIDELTALPGRRAYNEYCAQLSSPYTIAMTDIDHFKNFNDTYGHDTGDEVLKLVAKIISTVGGGGKAYRFGGEEFVIIFDGIEKEQSLEYLEEIRHELEKTPFTVRNKETRSKYEKTGKRTKTEAAKTVNITMSIGVADSKKDTNPEKVMKKADTALYKAKNAGRNRVAV